MKTLNKKLCQKFLKQCEVMSALGKHYAQLQRTNRILIEAGKEGTKMHKDTCRNLCDTKTAIKLTNKGLDMVINGIIKPDNTPRNGIIYPVQDTIDIDRIMLAVRSFNKKP